MPTVPEERIQFSLGERRVEAFRDDEVAWTGSQLANDVRSVSSCHGVRWEDPQLDVTLMVSVVRVDDDPVVVLPCPFGQRRHRLCRRLRDPLLRRQQLDRDEPRHRRNRQLCPHRDDYDRRMERHEHGRRLERLHAGEHGRRLWHSDARTARNPQERSPFRALALVQRVDGSRGEFNGFTTRRTAAAPLTVL
jgi:hypothetical protein